MAKAVLLDSGFLIRLMNPAEEATPKISELIQKKQ